MRALFGVVALVLVLAVVGVLATRRPGPPATAVDRAGLESAPVDTVVPKVSPNAIETRDRVRGDIDRAFRDAAASRAASEP